MASIPGVLSYCAFGHETTWGTTVPRTNFFPLKPSGDSGPSISRDTVDSETLEDGSYLSESVYEGRRQVGGSLELEFSYVGWTQILSHAFGNRITPPALVGGAYTWVFQPPSIPDIAGLGLSVEMVRGPTAASAQLYSGCKITRFQLSAEPSQIAKVTIDWIGKDASLVTKTALPAYNGVGFKYRPHMVFPTGQSNTLCQINAVARKCRSFKLTYDNHYEGSSVIESKGIVEPSRTAKSEATLDLTLEFEDLNEFTDFLAFTARTIILTIRNGADTLTQTTVSLGSCLLTNSPEPFVNSQGFITWSPQYKSRAIAASGAREVIFTYKNTIESGYIV